MKTAIILVLSLFSLAPVEAQSAYGHLKTRWAKDVSPTLPHPEYPRPQMTRERWVNLNGPWNYAITAVDASEPVSWAGRILVPFPIESQLSGVQLRVTPEQRLWYHRSFNKPSLLAGERLLLHFGAVDWHTVVYLNGKRVGEHKGGYDPFTLDITDALSPAAGQSLTLSVWDPTNQKRQPNGKQRLNPGGIFYTPVTGIWQTVWLEPVSAIHIESLHIVPDIDRRIVKVEAAATSAASAEVSILQNGREIARKTVATGVEASVALRNVHLWSPEDPFLYDLKVTLREKGKVVDEVKGYFGMRKMSLIRDRAGVTRMALNNKPYFQIGPLDQGWWPDGLYAAPTDDALRYDIEATKKLGMNVARKHVKLEPDRWYYWADKLGLLVWQDMPSTTGGVGVSDSQDLTFTREDADQFQTELKALIDAVRNHPSIVVWVPFNEGWGQHETNDILKWVKNYDPSRLVDGPSGWLDRGYGDLYDLHRYPGVSMFPTQRDRATVLGEFGGLGLIAKGHLWIEDRNWGYQQFDSAAKLQARYGELMSELNEAIQCGLSAAIYTQTTDVEIEVNGLMTYDREMTKFDPARLNAWHAQLKRFATTAKRPQTLLPASEVAPQAWRYSTQDAGPEWAGIAFDDSRWQTGNAPFADPDVPLYRAATPWRTGKIWLRRRFNLANPATAALFFNLHNNDRVTIFINGKQVRQEGGYSPGYRWSPLGDPGRAALLKGENVLAVVCEPGRHRPFVDVGLIEMKPIGAK